MAGALDGIRVLELTRVGPGAYCTMMLADMGAEVIKVETPPGAQAKKGSTSAISPDASNLREAAFKFTNRNKLSIALNLRAPEGQRVLQKLAQSADVLVEGFRPGTTSRLGCDFETLNTLNPRLVYCSMSGFGSGGPYRDLPGHDLTYISFAGTLSMIGQPGQPPAIPPNIIGDYASASLHAVIGILMALMARERTGKGQLVDVSFLDGAVALTAAAYGMWQYFAGAALPQRGATWVTGAYPYNNCYETKDGKYLTIACIEPHFWNNLCRTLGREDLLPYHRDPSHTAAVPDEKTRWATEELRTIFKTKTRDDWFEILRNEDVCVGKVYTWDEVADDPQVRFREMIVKIDDPAVGPVRQAGIPIKLSATPGTIRQLGPYLGQHTDEILSSLHYSEAEITRLTEEGVVA